MAYSKYYKSRNVSGLGRKLNEYFASTVVNEILRYSKNGDGVVEIGPGEGRVADLLHASHRYCAYEASPDLARDLKTRGIEVRESYAPPLLEKDDSQQVVVATHVLEHMSNHANARQLFSEAQRVLAPGGILFVISPDFNDMGKLFFDVDYSHSFITTPNRLSQIAKDAGLVVAKKKFLYGALPFFPGIVFNVLVKLAFWFLKFFKENSLFEYRGIFKAEYMFSRAIYMVFLKPK
jgi:SAM-dependent methyltransferase